MIANIKALIVVLTFALVIMRLGRASMVPLISLEEQQRLQRLFIIGSCASFLLPDFWLYTAVIVPVLRKEASTPLDGDEPAWRATLWMWMMLVVPGITVYVPGFGIIGYLFEISHIRLMGFVLLMSSLFVVRPKSLALGSHPVDICVAAYIALQAAILLLYYDTTFTDWIRVTFLSYTDTWLPYWAMSRSFKTVPQLKRALAALSVAGMIMSCLGVVEMLRGWALYECVEIFWGVDWALSIFLMRDGYLRAQVSSGHSLVFAFYTAVCLSVWVWLSGFAAKRWVAWLGIGVIAAGLGSSLSRGSWMAMGAAFAVLAVLSKRPVRNLIIMGVGSVGVALVLAAFVPSFQELIDKAMGASGAAPQEVDSEKEYRQVLLETAVGLIMQSPWFGVPNAFAYMEHLRQGQGIIDIVNSYVAVALSFGVTTLTPFVLMFLINIWRLFTLRLKLGKDHEGAEAASMLISLTVGVLVMIFSTSSISVIPFMYFALNGIMVSADRLYRPPPPSRRNTAS